jgi:hypothetical protein
MDDDLDWELPAEDLMLLDPECPTKRGHEIAAMSTQRPPAAYEVLRDSCRIRGAEDAGLDTELSVEAEIARVALARQSK